MGVVRLRYRIPTSQTAAVNAGNRKGIVVGVSGYVCVVLGVAFSVVAVDSDISWSHGGFFLWSLGRVSVVFACGTNDLLRLLSAAAQLGREGGRREVASSEV